jgi:hypothetical protein
MSNKLYTPPEITIIPANDPKDVKLNWIVKEYIGAEIYKDPITQALLTNKDDIRPGHEIYAYDIKAIVNDDGESASSQKFLYILEFDTDDRHAWVCTGVCNMRAISKLKFEE